MTRLQPVKKCATNHATTLLGQQLIDVPGPQHFINSHVGLLIL